MKIATVIVIKIEAEDNIKLKENILITHTTFPLSEEIFFNLDTIDQSQYLIDVDKIDFGEDEDNIESSIIYMRNLEIKMPLDFSNINYENKCKWILEYLTFNLFNISIPTLSETILTILANEDIGLNCILSQEEVLKFRNENEKLINEIIDFLISLNTVILILLNNKDNEDIIYNKEDLNIKDIIYNKPNYYNCIKNIILEYPEQIDGIRLFYNYLNKDKDIIFYDYIIKDISSKPDFYDGISKLPTFKFIGLLSSNDDIIS